MVFQEIDKLKKDYTDKYVVVDDHRPELKRFQGMTGLIKTVNMNGRALVEFDAYQNIGWFDIEIDFLKVVDKPAPEAKTEKAAPPAAKKPAAKKPAAKKPAAEAEKKSEGGMSVADILSAARGGEGAKADSTKPKAAASTADILAAARGEAAPAAQKPTKQASKPADASNMSVEDILAAARGGGAPAAAEESPAEKDVAEVEATEEEAVTEEEAATEEPATEPEKSASGPLPTNVDEIVEFCRERDG
ncbi:MAG: hypothetical protein GY768_25905 [Planctomycetaceae bacterium]|nr:hypothetical protein [Planctomycetaceae bacterium]